MGFLVLVEGPFFKGDWIKVGTSGVEGTVEEIGLRRTLLRDGLGSMNAVSNGLIRMSDPDHDRSGRTGRYHQHRLGRAGSNGNRHHPRVGSQHGPRPASEASPMAPGTLHERAPGQPVDVPSSGPWTLR